MLDYSILITGGPIQHLHMLQARVTFSRSQIRCYVTIYAICHATLNFRIEMKKKITPNILSLAACVLIYNIVHYM